MTSHSYAQSNDGHHEGLWLQHKDVLHMLYITENKTLSQVRHIMESLYDFPVLRLHDYEVALRRVLKLRKNLKKEEWSCIGDQIFNRKSQGKESEVLWKDRPLTTKKVRKEVLRNRKVRGLLPRKTELPVGIMIRTPPGSPSEELVVMGTPADLQLDPQPVTCMSHHENPNAFHAETTASGVQISSGGTGQVNASRFRHLREDIPFNRFMMELMNLVKSHSLSIAMPVEYTWTPAPRLVGWNPSLDILAHLTFQCSNKLGVNWRSDENSWFLKWLGVSADLAVLRTFFSVKTPTVCALYESLCKEVRVLRRPAAARVLFEIRNTVRKNYTVISDEASFLQTAVELGSKADGMLQCAKRAFARVLSPLEMASLRPTQHLQSLFMIAAAQREMPMLRLLVGAVMHSDDKTEFKGNGATRLLALIMRQIYGGIVSTRLSAWCCCTDRPQVSIRNCESLTVDELVMMCPPFKRKHLFSVIMDWSEEHRIFISKAGIFSASLDGVHGVLSYLRSCKKKQTYDIHAILQECLFFASRLNDTNTAAPLLELGTDPEVNLLSNNKEPYHKGILSWDPMIVAAAAGNLEMLNLLSKGVNLLSFFQRAPIYEIVQVEDAQERYEITKGMELRRLENLQRHCNYSRTRISDAAVANGTISFNLFTCHDGLCTLESVGEDATAALFMTEKRRLDTLTRMRDISMALGIRQSLDIEIIDAALFIDKRLRILQCRITTYHPCDVLLLESLVDANIKYRESGMDLLQLSIRAQCSLKVMEFLLGKGLRVHSETAAQSGHTMLHDALLNQSCDRSKIVKALLRERAEYKCCGQGPIILEASLRQTQLCRRRDSLDLFTHLFELGAPVRPWKGSRLETQSALISRLLDADAEDELILRVLDAGAELNTPGRSRYPLITGRMTPLQAAIFKNREKLAREFIRRGADVHARRDGSSLGSTALQIACSSRRTLQFIEYLVVVQGADVNEAPGRRCGTTALQNAAGSGALSVAEFLLAHGSDVNALSGEFLSLRGQESLPRYRPLDCAAERGRLDMVEFLLKAGGRSATAGLGGAMQLARENGHFAIFSVLQDWEKEHDNRIMIEEAEWQQQNPDSARVLLETRSRDNFSEDSTSESGDSLEGDIDE